MKASTLYARVVQVLVQSVDGQLLAALEQPSRALCLAYLAEQVSQSASYMRGLPCVFTFFQDLMPKNHVVCHVA